MRQGLPFTGSTRAPSRWRRRAGAVVFWLVAAAWVMTMAELARREVLAVTESSDVRELVDTARLKHAFASARYVVRLGNVEIGELSTTVTGGQREEQLAYVVRCRLERPALVEARGFVLADWDRRVTKFVLEARTGHLRHRLEGGLEPEIARADEVPFRVSYRPPTGSPFTPSEWVLPAAPVLAPGPLPVPDFALFDAPPGASGATAQGRSGALVDPVSGDVREWRLSPPRAEDVAIAWRSRPSLRHDLRYGDLVATLWTEASGFPLRFELPPALEIVLVEEHR